MKFQFTIMAHVAFVIPVYAGSDHLAGFPGGKPEPEPIVDMDLHIRTEVEAYDNQDWIPGADDAYYYQRVILSTRWHLTADVDLAVSPYHAWAWEKEVISPVDINRLAFLELGFDWRMMEDHTFHIGRGMLDFGSGRLVSSRMGPNVPRAFDTIRHVWSPGSWKVQLLYAREVRAEPGSFDDPVFDDDATLWGIYSTWKPAEECGMDFYLLGTEQQDDRITTGWRYFGRSAGWDWDLEMIGQGGGGIRAGSVASTVARTFTEHPWSPRLGLKASVSSGDDPDTDRNETFSPLYPRGDYFSETATVGPLNHIELHTFLVLTLDEGTKVILETASLWKATRDDAIYAVAGYPLRPADPDGGRFTGQETSVSLTRRIGERLSMEISGSWFHPGPAVRGTGPADDMLYGKISLGYDF